MKSLFFGLFGILFSSPLFSVEQARSDAADITAQGSQFVGYAYDLKTGELRYEERHRRITDGSGNKVVYTDYVDANEKELAKRIVRYQGDGIAKFELSDAITQETVSAIRKHEKVLLKKTSDAVSTEREIELNVDLDNIIDAGFNDYVLNHWDELANGEKKRFNFLSTEREGWIRLMVKDAGVREESGYQIRSFQMTLANPMVRILMKPIKVEYYADMKELYRYEGISNLKRENGKNYSVRIEFPRKDYHDLVHQSDASTSRYAKTSETSLLPK